MRSLTLAAATLMIYRPDIDGLRAIAVLAVVLFHAEVPGLGGGYVGVDVFFVISGYLITQLLQEARSINRTICVVGNRWVFCIISSSSR